MIPSRRIRLVVISLVLVCTAGCDQITEHVARTELGQMGSATLPGRFLEFTLAENPGTALSLGSTFPPAARSALTACVAFTSSLGVLAAQPLIIVAEPRTLLFLAFPGSRQWK